MGNTVSTSVGNTQYSIFDNLNSDVYLSEYSISAYAGSEAESGVSEDNVLPPKAGIPKPLESVNSNVNVEKACINENNKKNLFMCSYCKKTFSAIRNRDRHIHEQHKGTKDYSCTECGRPFYRNACMVDHLRKVHDKVLMFKCPGSECNKVAFNKPNIKRHCHKIHKYCIAKDNIGAIIISGNSTLDKGKFSISGNINVDKYCDSVGVPDIEEGDFYSEKNNAGTFKVFGSFK